MGGKGGSLSWPPVFRVSLLIPHYLSVMYTVAIGIATLQTNNVVTKSPYMCCGTLLSLHNAIDICFNALC